MSNKINIFVQGFDWSEVVESPEESNFFNKDVEPEEITPRIDINGFRIGRGFKMKYDIDEAETETNEFFFNCSDLTFKVTDRLPVRYPDGTLHRLRDFFKLREDTTYIKYSFELFVNDKLVYSGTIHQESLEESFNTESSNKEINIRVTGFETEFRDYFKNSSLLPSSNSIWTGEVRDTDNVFRTRFTGLPNFLNKMFPGVSFLLEDSLQDYLVAESAAFFYTSENRLWFLKCGYERIVAQGDENRFEMLRKICCERGWIFFFAVVDNELKLVIANRANKGFPNKTINVNKFTNNGFKIKKKKPIAQFDYLLIVDGTMRDTGGGTEYGFINNPAFTGERLIILSNKAKEVYRGNHFNGIALIDGAYQLVYTAGYKMGKFWNEDDQDFRYRIFSHKHDQGTEYSIKQNRILRLPHGANTREAMVINVRTKENYGWTVGVGNPEHEATSGDILYYGTYASMIFKSSDGVKCETYQDDVLKPQFRNNYLKFLTNKNNQMLDVEVHEAIFNPYYSINFTGTDEINPNDSYSILSLEVDPEAGINGITNLSLQKNAV